MDFTILDLVACLCIGYFIGFFVGRKQGAKESLSIIAKAIDEVVVAGRKLTKEKEKSQNET